jgi:hypothetical protein
MLAALFLGISRCVSVDLCPDDETLMTALRGRDEAVAAAMTADGPENLTTYHSAMIKGVSDVICGEALPGDLPTVTCKFTVRYSHRDAYEVARLVKKDGTWEIDLALAVNRARR